MAEIDNLKHEMLTLQRHLEILAEGILSGEACHLDPVSGKREYIQPAGNLCACTYCRLARRYV